MELPDNAAVLTVPAAMNAGPASPLFWGTMAGSLAVAFVFTTPINRAMIRRGQSHAVLHQHHHAPHWATGGDRAWSTHPHYAAARDRRAA